MKSRIASSSAGTVGTGISTIRAGGRLAVSPYVASSPSFEERIARQSGSVWRTRRNRLMYSAISRVYGRWSTEIRPERARGRVGARRAACQLCRGRCGAMSSSRRMSMLANTSASSPSSASSTTKRSCSFGFRMPRDGSHSSAGPHAPHRVDDRSIVLTAPAGRSQRHACDRPRVPVETRVVTEAGQTLSTGRGPDIRQIRDRRSWLAGNYDADSTTTGNCVSLWTLA